MNSKAKGKRGELEAVHFLNELGFQTRRTAQYCGNTGEAADVEGIDGLHLEVKRCEAVHLKEWTHQAERDCGDKIPVVLTRQNGEPWRVILRAEDFFKMWRAYEIDRRRQFENEASRSDKESIRLGDN